MVGVPFAAPASVPGRLARFSAIEAARWSRAVARAFAPGDFDVVEGPAMSGEVLSILALPSRPPVVVRIHGGTSMGLRIRGRFKWYHRPIHRRERESIRRADGVTLAGEVARRVNADYFRVCLDRAAVIANPIDTDRFTPADGPGDPGPPAVLFAGRLNRVKGFDLMPVIVRGVLARFPATRFVFVGADREPADDVPAQTARAALLGALPAAAAANVEFAGVVPQAAMVERYRAARVVVAPSRVETFSLVCAEAAACGVPVVGSRGTGIEAVVVDGETGYLADVGDTAAFAGRICELVGDAARARDMGTRARMRAARCFGLRAVAEATVGAYEAVMRGGCAAERRTQNAERQTSK